MDASVIMQIILNKNKNGLLTYISKKFDKKKNFKSSKQRKEKKRSYKKRFKTKTGSVATKKSSK